MRILFLSDNFPPETNAPAIRTHEHTREWVRRGHEVTVVTCAPNFPKGVVHEGYRNRLSQSEWIDGVRVVRVWSYIAANEGMLRRILDFVSFMLSATLRCVFLPRPDVVVATSPQFFAAVAGRWVSILKWRPFVFELRDLWPESVTAVGAVRNRKLLRPFESMARRLYRKADLLVPVTQAFAKHLREEGVADERICVVTNGIEPEEITPEDPRTVRSREGIPADAFVCAFVGTLGMAHGLETVLEAAAETAGEPDILYLLMGEGADKQKIRSMIREEGRGNVLLLDGRPRSDALDILNAADVSLVLLKDTPLFETVIPSKIFEAMALRKPIVLGVRGESRRIVEEEARCGLAFPPGDASALVASVRRLKADRDLCASLGEAGHAAVSSRFRRRELASRMLDALQKVAG